MLKNGGIRENTVVEKNEQMLSTSHSTKCLGYHEAETMAYCSSAEKAEMREQITSEKDSTSFSEVYSSSLFKKRLGLVDARLGLDDARLGFASDLCFVVSRRVASCRERGCVADSSA